LLEEQNGKLDAVIGELRADKVQRAAIYKAQSDDSAKQSGQIKQELWRLAG